MPDDSVVALRDGRVSHLDCRMPRALSAEERGVLVFYCFDHAVAECVRCRWRFREVELSTDYVNGHTHRCPFCGDDLTDSVRIHLYGCAMAPEKIRRKAQAVRETARRLVKESRQLRDDADLLAREAEALLDACRHAVGQKPDPSLLVLVSYRGWKIEPRSYCSAGDRWCPSASLRTVSGAYAHTEIVPTRMFATRRDADTCAIASAKDLIDKLLV